MSTTERPNNDLSQTVGLFGLGLIGSAIATRLIAAGIVVLGFDPDPDCVSRLQELGGKPSLPEQVWQADIIISAVFNTEQLDAMITAAPPGNKRALISVSTCDPDQMPALANKATEKGYDLIEAPISGTSADLASGDAILVVAGDVAVAKTLAPVFDVLAREHYHVGAIGNGNRAKLAINLVLGLSRAAVAEGIVFAKAVGLDQADFLELALNSAASSKVMASKGPMMVSRNFEPLGRIAQSAKDFHLIQDTATRARQGLPLTQRYLEIVDDSLINDEGDLDNSAVLLAIERTAPVE
jgi:3-hydroxyisobutyrate dehydrogenase-like beta-hydroxyacid dehydrogenase